MAIDNNRSIKLRISGNWNTDPETLASLAKSKDVEVRRAVAGNGSTPVESLSVLSKDKDRAVRERVASNFNTSANTLDEMAKASESQEYIFEDSLSNWNTIDEGIDIANAINRSFAATTMSVEKIKEV